MLTYNLFNKILIEPATTKPVTRLQIISAFATPYIVKKHMEQLASLNRPIHIELIIGMPQKYIDEEQHIEFCELMRKNTNTNIRISCKYIMSDMLVHAKTYCWLFEDGRPAVAFAGSANYTMTAFGMSRNNKQKEVMAYVNAKLVAEFYDTLKYKSVDCTHPEALNCIKPMSKSSETLVHKRKPYQSYFKSKKKNLDYAWLILLIIIILIILLGK